MIKTEVTITCDICGYSTDNAGVYVKTYQMDDANNNWWYNWTRQELCDDCLIQYKLANPDIKVKEYGT